MPCTGYTGTVGDTIVPTRDNRLLRLSADDNVLIVGRQISEGETYHVDGLDLTALVDLPIGSKIAFVDLQPDDIVLRLGVPIGRITQPTDKGSLVHSHNLVSQRQSATVRIEIVSP